VAIPCTDPEAVPFGPTAALLGIVNLTGTHPLRWTDDTGASQPVKVKFNDGILRIVEVTETPKLGSTEAFEISNFTVDAHPIHLHLVAFQVVSRACRPASDCVTPHPVEPSETGYKDTVIAYPGEITTVKAKFDIPGLYVWHCHIVEHEDNEMMRPYVVSAVPPPPHHHDFDDRDRDHHKMKHQYRWAAKHK
jgi:FtsP/CotA-like multicopper oxidase with cupredoxin domain